jgi:L-2-hydroxyglutarate oxidase LhgO
VEQIDTAIIGAGVVGLAAALAVSRRGRSVVVLEREPHAGMGMSTHNSQVIHAGMYYPAGTLKAKHCVAGAAMLYDFCERHGVRLGARARLSYTTSARGRGGPTAGAAS